MKAINLVVRFLLELCALAALGFWGWQAGGSLPLQLLLAVLAPLLAAAAWGALVAPKARRRLPDPGRLLVELAVFGAATAGLLAAGAPRLALALAVVYAANVTLMFIWRQRDA